MSILASHKKAVAAASKKAAAEAVAWIDAQLSDIHEGIETFRKGAAKAADIDPGDDIEKAESQSRAQGEVYAYEHAQKAILNLKKAMLERFG